MRQIAVYKKVALEKNTTKQNMTAALSIMGNKILLVGCDLNTDSTRILPGGLNQKKLYKNTF